MGEARFKIAPFERDKITLLYVEVDLPEYDTFLRVRGLGVSCADHLEQLEFTFPVKVRGQVGEACFTVEFAQVGTFWEGSIFADLVVDGFSPRSEPWERRDLRLSNSRSKEASTGFVHTWPRMS